MTCLVGGPLLVGSLGPGPPGPPLNPALMGKSECKIRVIKLPVQEFFVSRRLSSLDDKPKRWQFSRESLQEISE